MIQCAMLDWWWVFELVDIKMYTVHCCLPPYFFPLRQTCPQEYVGLACLTAAMVGMMQILAPRHMFGQCAVGDVRGESVFSTGVLRDTCSSRSIHQYLDFTSSQ